MPDPGVLPSKSEDILPNFNNENAAALYRRFLKFNNNYPCFNHLDAGIIKDTKTMFYFENLYKLITAQETCYKPHLPLEKNGQYFFWKSWPYFYFCSSAFIIALYEQGEVK